MSLSHKIRKAPWVLRYRYGAELASDLRRLSVLATHRHCHVEFRGPVRIGPGFELRIPDAGTLVVGEGVDFRNGFVCEISGEGRVTIGDLSCFTSQTLIQCTTSIDIGRRCIFGQSALLVDGSHRFRDPTKHVMDQGYDYRPVSIGDGVVVMAKCTIFADIGEGSVVGAHSVVSRSLPERCLALGAPARPVEFFDDPGRPQPSEPSQPQPQPQPHKAAHPDQQPHLDEEPNLDEEPRLYSSKSRDERGAALVPDAPGRPS